MRVLLYGSDGLHSDLGASRRLEDSYGLGRLQEAEMTTYVYVPKKIVMVPGEVGI